MIKPKLPFQAVRWLAPVLTVAVLAAMGAQPMFDRKPADADAYHARVRAAAAVPLVIGDWQGVDTAVPEAAITMLRPNVVISRQYRNMKTGAFASFLIMQCEDGRDLAGHYPPNCYPGNGWRLAASQPANWTISGMEIGGMEYEFYKHGALQDGHIFAENFLIMPDGAFIRDMAQYHRLAFDYRKRYYGAAQVQVVFDGDTLPEDRQAGALTFIGACEPFIQVIRSGCRK